MVIFSLRLILLILSHQNTGAFFLFEEIQRSIPLHFKVETKWLMISFRADSFFFFAPFGSTFPQRLHLKVNKSPEFAPR